MKPFLTQLFIDGELTDGRQGTRTLLTNPATQEEFLETSAAGVEDLEPAIDSAWKVFQQEWRNTKSIRRGEILYSVARKLRENIEIIAQAESHNIGKPISDARDEAELGARIFEYYAGALSHFGGQTLPVGGGGLDITVREPMGVVAAIVPWNFPFPIACWKAAPALAAGNAVILKPASLSPLTAILLGTLAHEAGLPAGLLQVLPGPGGLIGEALVKHPLIRKVSFTGSTEIGSQVMNAASAGIKRVSLELGGKSPNIVFADADIAAAAASSPMSVFANTGQDCCARSRVFVEESVLEEYLDQFIQSTEKIVVGDPLSEATQIGPLVSEQQRTVSETFVKEARENGRMIRTGGERPLEKGFYYSPTIVTGIEVEDRIWREEVFGPVVCIRPFRDEETMLREVNDSPYGLSGSIWTSDVKRAIRLARAVESGVLGINTNSTVHVEAPFGGFKQSGIGRDLGMSALEGYTELKNIYFG